MFFFLTTPSLFFCTEERFGKANSGPKISWLKLNFLNPVFVWTNSQTSHLVQTMLLKQKNTKKWICIFCMNLRKRLKVCERELKLRDRHVMIYSHNIYVFLYIGNIFLIPDYISTSTGNEQFINERVKKKSSTNACTTVSTRNYMYIFIVEKVQA